MRENVDGRFFPFDEAAVMPYRFGGRQHLIIIAMSAPGPQRTALTLDEEKAGLLMTNVQLYLAISVPIVVNAAMFGLLLAYMNARFDGLRSEMNERFNGMNERFNGVNERFNGVNQRFQSIDQRFQDIERRFDAINQRFDDMRDLWRAELHRVEEILDARLKHIEERRG